MHVNGFKEKWIEVFARAGIELDIAQEEFAEWVSGLGGDLDNGYTNRVICDYGCRRSNRRAITCARLTIG